MTEREIEQRIVAIKREISSLGPLRPGSLSRQYNVCGNPTCRCKADPAQRHGPYYQLSYKHQKKSTSEFVREPDVAQVEQQLRNYAAAARAGRRVGRAQHRAGPPAFAPPETGSKFSPKLARTPGKASTPEPKMSLPDRHKALVPQGHNHFRDRN